MMNFKFPFLAWACIFVSCVVSGILRWSSETLFINKRKYMGESIYFQENPIVHVSEGKLRGALKTLVNGEKYYSFRGIRYAQPPVGNLRFTAPRPPLPWRGVRDAIEHGPVCPQFDMLSQKFIEGSEDCLFLNVYTKNLSPYAKIPVMVFIHGGANIYGSGNYENCSPDLLLQHDNVLLVTMNYRLEVLGNLCLDTPEVPGNCAMKDQVAGFSWIKKNIANFGGDPNRITIFGESAGAGSVTYHLLSPMSTGLFHGAIVQSGVCTETWLLQEDPVERAFRLGRSLGKDAKNTDELLQFLRQVKPLVLTNVTYQSMTEDEKLRGLPFHFAPVVEKKFPNTTAFITERPIDLLTKGKINKVALMLGYTSAEGIAFIGFELPKLDFRNKNPSYFVPRTLVEKVSQKTLLEFGERIKRFYAGDGDITKDDPEIIVNLLTDLYFAYQSHRFVNLYSGFNVPVYMYRFNYTTDLNVAKGISGYLNLPGASHGDDIFYLFLQDSNRNAYTEQPKLRDIVFNVTTKIWTDFAKYGYPTPNPVKGVKWTPYTQAGKEYLNLQEGLSMGQFADRARMEFWDQLYEEAGLPNIN